MCSRIALDLAAFFSRQQCLFRKMRAFSREASGERCENMPGLRVESFQGRV
jgi:hypothetical protein